MNNKHAQEARKSVQPFLHGIEDASKTFESVRVTATSAGGLGTSLQVDVVILPKIEFNPYNVRQAVG